MQSVDESKCTWGEELSGDEENKACGFSVWTPSFSNSKRRQKQGWLDTSDTFQSDYRIKAHFQDSHNHNHEP